MIREEAEEECGTLLACFLACDAMKWMCKQTSKQAGKVPSSLPLFLIFLYRFEMSTSAAANAHHCRIISLHCCIFFCFAFYFACFYPVSHCCCWLLICATVPRYWACSGFQNHWKDSFTMSTFAFCLVKCYDFALKADLSSRSEDRAWWLFLARIPFRTKSAFLAFPLLLLFCCRLFNYSAVRADFVFFSGRKNVRTESVERGVMLLERKHSQCSWISLTWGNFIVHT